MIVCMCGCVCVNVRVCVCVSVLVSSWFYLRPCPLVIDPHSQRVRERTSNETEDQRSSSRSVFDSICTCAHSWTHLSNTLIRDTFVNDALSLPIRSSCPFQWDRRSKFKFAICSRLYFNSWTRSCRIRDRRICVNLFSIRQRTAT